MWIFACSVVSGVSSVKGSVYVNVLSVLIVPGLECKNKWCIQLYGCALYQLVVALPAKKTNPFGLVFFVYDGERTRTHLNATPRWGVARFRLDGIDTLL